MKKISGILCATFFVISAFVASPPAKTGIHGSIDPPQNAKKIWAISSTADSVSIIPSAEIFFIEVKPGSWKLLVEATKPFKNTEVENIIVKQDQSTDAGVIKLLSE